MLPLCRRRGFRQNLGGRHLLVATCEAGAINSFECLADVLPRVSPITRGGRSTYCFRRRGLSRNPDVPGWTLTLVLAP